MKKILPLTLALVLLLTTGLFAQEKNVKHVRIVIDDNGKKTDTTFVVSGKDSDEVDKLVSVYLNDSTTEGKQTHSMPAQGTAHCNQMLFVTSDDDKTGSGVQRIVVMKKAHCDSMQYSYSISDSDEAVVNVNKSTIIRHSNGDVDTLVIEGLEEGMPFHGDVNVEKIITSEGDRKEVKVIVSSEPGMPGEPMANAFTWTPGPDQNVVIAHQGRPGMHGMPGNVEIKDVPDKNELQINDLFIFSQGKGRIMLNFSTGNSGELNLKITNDRKKEVFSTSLKYFDGDFHQEIQLGQEAQGSYFLTVTQNKKSIKKEISIR